MPAPANTDDSEDKSMSASKRSPLARLVLFMVCLAIAGSAGAGVHYYAVDLPVQKNVQVPENVEDGALTMETYAGATVDGSQWQGYSHSKY
ncbi:MAG: hypothetical protein CVV32_06395 [Methanomicrobiales archaeon HGW-Methanomicrobiales-3]|jgi:hypothetical protein|nr:MAG: hypothetical protein CVV32_06395 [Methanomicrobiales archaeon HGW-Methanomicrobiales-3]